MFQYAALERNNTTEPLGGRKKSRLAPQTVLQTSTVTPSFTQLKEIQLPHCAADCSDAAWNYSTCSDTHLDQEKILSRGTKVQPELRAVYLRAGDSTQEELRLKEEEGRKCTSSPQNSSLSSPVKRCNSSASYKHIFHYYGLLSKHSPPTYCVACWKEMLIYLML